MDFNFSIIKLCFFNTAIADIFRAIRGGSLIGAFTQSMCAIDAMAYLYNALPKEKTGKNFVKWTEDWIVPLNNNCHPEVLYALRCGLVHTYGYSKAMKECKMQGFAYVHNRPESHWTQPQPNIYKLNLDSHVAEVTVAAFNFFSSCAKDEALANNVETRAKGIIQIYFFSADRIKILTKSRFACMDAALAPLDQQKQPQVDVIASEIRKIYPGELK